MEDKCQILNLYSRIISIVTIELKVNFTLREETLLADSRIVDPDAYDAYLKGRSYLDGFNPESWYVAVESFEKAFEEMKKNSYVRWEKYGYAELLEEIFYDHGWIAFVQELARTYEEATANEMQVSPWIVSFTYFTLGNYDKTMDYFEILYEENNHHPTLPYQSSKNIYDKMNGNPRYIELLKKMNLPIN